MLLPRRMFVSFTQTKSLEISDILSQVFHTHNLFFFRPVGDFSTQKSGAGLCVCVCSHGGFRTGSAVGISGP